MACGRCARGGAIHTCLPPSERAGACSASPRRTPDWNEARAEHVVYDPDIRSTGGVAADGSLLGWSEGTSTAVAESRLTERIVERALDTGARLTPVEGAACEVLREAGGIAALLRC